MMVDLTSHLAFDLDLGRSADQKYQTIHKGVFFPFHLQLFIFRTPRRGSLYHAGRSLDRSHMAVSFPA